MAQEDILIRAFQKEDIEPLVGYWTGNSEEFWRIRGIDKLKLKSRSDFISVYEKAFRETGEVQGLATILYRGQSIGIHSLTDIIEHESAVFHAHIWSEVHRGLGIGVFSYLKAADFFIEKLKLKKIIFKTPKLNLAANRVKEKIGITCIGDTVFESPVLIAPLSANLYELDKVLLEKLKVKHAI